MNISHLTTRVIDLVKHRKDAATPAVVKPPVTTGSQTPSDWGSKAPDAGAGRLQPVTLPGAERVAQGNLYGESLSVRQQWAIGRNQETDFVRIAGKDGEVAKGEQLPDSVAKELNRVRMNLGSLSDVDLYRAKDGSGFVLHAYDYTKNSIDDLFFDGAGKLSGSESSHVPTGE